MARFIELTKMDNNYGNRKICINCDTITFIEPNGDYCWIRFGYGHQVVVTESYDEVCELIEIATRDTISTL